MSMRRDGCVQGRLGKLGQSHPRPVPAADRNELTARSQGAAGSTAVVVDGACLTRAANFAQGFPLGRDAKVSEVEGRDPKPQAVGPRDSPVIERKVEKRDVANTIDRRLDGANPLQVDQNRARCSDHDVADVQVTVQRPRAVQSVDQFAHPSQPSALFERVAVQGPVEGFGVGDVPGDDQGATPRSPGEGQGLGNGNGQTVKTLQRIPFAFGGAAPGEPLQPCQGAPGRSGSRANRKELLDDDRIGDRFQVQAHDPAIGGLGESFPGVFSRVLDPSIDGGLQFGGAEEPARTHRCTLS